MAKKGLIAVNPAQGLRSLRRDDISDAEKRIPFTPEQIIAFFNREFYRRCVASGPAPHRFDTKGWRFGCRLSACSAACAPTRSANCTSMTSASRLVARGTLISRPRLTRMRRRLPRRSRPYLADAGYRSPRAHRTRFPPIRRGSPRGSRNPALQHQARRVGELRDVSAEALSRRVPAAKRLQDIWRGADCGGARLGSCAGSCRNWRGFQRDGARQGARANSSATTTGTSRILTTSPVYTADCGCGLDLSCLHVKQLE